MKISRIKINGMNDPVGFSFEDLRCAWVVTDTEAKQASNAKIDVAKDEEFMTVLYTKEGTNLNSACEPLEMALEPCTRYYVRIQVTGDNGEQGDHSDLHGINGRSEKFHSVPPSCLIFCCGIYENAAV